jgi:polyisoprenoid-binding protein YceI
MKRWIPLALLALAPVAALAKAETYKVDTAQSILQWEGRKKLVDSGHHGTLKLRSGELQMEGGNIVGGTFDVDMTSLKVEDLTDPKMNAKLSGHLKSDDFFSIDKYPTARFVIKKATKGANGQTEVTGDLTIKGKTATLSFPVEMKQEKGKTQFSGNASVDRTKYDVKYNSLKFFSDLVDKAIISDEFGIKMNIVTAK